MTTLAMRPRVICLIFPPKVNYHLWRNWYENLITFHVGNSFNSQLLTEIIISPPQGPSTSYAKDNGGKYNRFLSHSTHPSTSSYTCIRDGWWWWCHFMLVIYLLSMREQLYVVSDIIPKTGKEWARARMKWDFYAVNIVQSRIAELSSLCYVSITHKNAVKSFLLFCFVFPSAAAVGAFSRDVRHSVLASSHTLQRGSPSFGVAKATTKAERAREYRQPKNKKRTLEIWLESRDLSLFFCFLI